MPSPSRALGRCTMQGKIAEDWRELCSQAAQEQDPNRLLELALKINTLLEEKERRLKTGSNTLTRGKEDSHHGHITARVG
jgi:hypothetical protein